MRLASHKNFKTFATHLALGTFVVLGTTPFAPTFALSAEELEAMIKKELAREMKDEGSSFDLKRDGDTITITDLRNQDNYQSDTYKRDETTTLDQVILADIEDLGGNSTKIGKITVSGLQQRTDRAYTTKSNNGDKLRENNEGFSIAKIEVENAEYIEKQNVSFTALRVNNIAVFDSRDRIAFNLDSVNIGPIKLPDIFKNERLPREEEFQANLKAVNDFAQIFEFATIKGFSGNLQSPEDVNIEIKGNELSFIQTRTDDGKRSVTFDVDQISIPISVIEQSPEFKRDPEAKIGLTILKEAGYETISASLNWALNLDEPARTASFSYGVALNEILGISYSLGAQNIPAALFNPADNLDYFEDEKTLPLRLMSIGLSGFELKIENLSGFERLVKAGAKHFDLDETVLLQQIEAGAVFGATFLSRFDKDFGKEVTNAAKAFFADPGNLTFSLSPDPAVSIAELPLYFDGEPDPKLLIERFNPSVTVNQ